jgi:outer membrane protein TolC
VGQPQIPTMLVPNFTNPGGPPLEFQMGISNSLTAKVQVNQLLFDGTFFLGLRAAKEYVELANNMIATTEAETELNVTKAYYLALITAENVTLVEENLKVIEKIYSDTKALKENGFAEKIDVQRLELQVSNLKIQLTRLGDQREITLKLLKFHMGMDVNKEIVLTDKLADLMTKVMALDADGKITYNSRPEYKVLEQGQVLNQLNLKRYRVGYLPSLYGFASHQQQTFAVKGEIGNLGNKFYGGTMVGLSLQIPIFDGLRKHSLTQQTKLQILQTQNNLLNLELAIQNEVFMARTRFQTVVLEVENQKKNMELADNIYKIAEAKFKEGVGSSFEVTTANNDKKMAETNYLNAIYDLLIAEISYKKAIGQIK